MPSHSGGMRVVHPHCKMKRGGRGSYFSAGRLARPAITPQVRDTTPAVTKRLLDNSTTIPRPNTLKANQPARTAMAVEPLFCLVADGIRDHGLCVLDGAVDVRRSLARKLRLGRK